MWKCARAPYAANGLTKFWMEKSCNNKAYNKVNYTNGGFNSTRLLETFTMVESKAESKAKKKHKLRPSNLSRINPIYQKVTSTAHWFETFFKMDNGKKLPKTKAHTTSKTHVISLLASSMVAPKGHQACINSLAMLA